MKVLVIAAHPDDEVYGMGGTIARLSDEGNEVHVLIVTDGATAQYKGSPGLTKIISEKTREAKLANNILGVSKVHFGGLPDMRLDNVDHIEVNRVIEKVIGEEKPDIVYTHFYGDVNLDHQYVYRSTLVAVRPAPDQLVKELYCYRVPSSTEWSPQIPSSVFLPNVFVDISRYIPRKQKAIKAYKTEIRDFPHPRSVEYVEKCDYVAGLKLGIGSAEEFMLIRKISPS